MTGGGIINRKSISILLLLLTIAIPLNVDAISAAATSQTNTDQKTSPSVTNNYIQNTTTKTSNTTTTNKSQVSTTKNTTTKNYAAAGTVKTVSSTKTTSLSFKNIVAASTSVKNFINTNKRLPSYVTISGVKITMPQMLYYLSQAIVKINSGTKTSSTLITVKAPTVNNTETVKAGNLTKNQYLSEASSVYNYILKNRMAPSTISSSLGKIRYESAIFSFSKVVSFYGTNTRLPKFVAIVPLAKSTVKPSTGTSTNGSSSGYVENVVPTSLKSYLLPTANCQSDNSQIKTLAASITKGLNTPMQRATAIYNWVRDHISYSFYYNTQKGALGTLSARTANCVDTAHLVVALERAAGFAAQYEHVTAQFSSGTWYGHVIALVYVNGVWYKADGTSYRNSFGVVNNWNTNTATVHGKYRELPF
ncbi:transglutaminase domain-containing protein [Methanobacterium lacus]|uniref:Transglutaminase domain-containing protein n=1 Tax=Methanobacterium lacus (strain AL-21) TaxID=877455 RepID=F0TA78_METLA|nr:transglutaminase domain-containing protein [Methanobacterium lacus]